jgi:hypothetical protein
MESSTQIILDESNQGELQKNTEKPKRSKKIRTLSCSDLSENIIENVNIIQYELTFENFCKYKLSLKSYKIPELKTCARKYHLPVSGAKPLLMQRIETAFKMINARILIQRIFRGYIVRKMKTLHGPAINNRSICSNETDFATMEPLSEIENTYFFSYTDGKDFTYGFNITSLISMMKSKSKMVNPYNREKLEQTVINNVISLHNINCIVFSTFRAENEPFSLKNTLRQYPQNRYVQPSPIIQPQTNDVMTNYNPPVNAALITDQETHTRYQRICEIRSKPLTRRISELFQEFDHLGNYTSQGWFLALGYREFIRLYRNLFEIWNYRAMLTREIKLKICPFHGPFESIFTRPLHYNELSFDQIKLACLIAMENLVYSGVDEDSRKIGAFHALSGLTIVSLPARLSMPWLYDSVADGHLL